MLKKLREKIRYLFDLLLSRGTIYLICLLFAIMMTAPTRSAVFVGYMEDDQGEQRAVVNPNKDTLLTFKEGDEIIVIAED